MKTKPILFLLLVLLPLRAPALSFRQVAYIPSGIIWSYGYIKGGDLNGDGVQDLVFGTMLAPHLPGVAYYAYRPYNRYAFQDSFRYAYSWDVGYLDQDSLLDVVTQAWDSVPGSTYIRVYESANRFAYPTVPVWTWRYEYIGTGVQGIYITDLDRDGRKEFLTADVDVIYVFENRGDNQYLKVFSDTVRNQPTPPFAVGDFDGDVQMEFAMGTSGGAPLVPTVYIYECTGPDQYQIVWNDTLNAWNMHDCITSPDLDGDGKIEFIIGDNHNGTQGLTGGLWIYEATGNNQYQIIYTDSVARLSDRGVYCPHSDCGDVDRDGRPELVWAIDRDWMVYKSPGNNQFQRVFSAYGDNGHNSTNIHIHDMNGNGYPEIIESGGNETHIWEVEACQVVYPNGGETLYGDSLTVIRWRNVTPFQADSFSLFYSVDSGLTYSPVARGIPGADSAYSWTVPKTYSDDCFVMIWAYQNATAWDFSDSHFRIRNGNGVEQGNGAPFSASRLPYRVAPNPFVSFAILPGHEKEQFALYDVSGRKVGNYPGSRIGYDLSAGIYFLKPEVKGSKPIRLVKLQ